MPTDAPGTTVWTVGSLLQWTEEFLRQKGVESARLEAQLLLAHVLRCSRSNLYVRFDEQPSDSVKAKFRELISRRVEGVPVAYLIGLKEFFLLSFEVTPDVLIPRPATETLVMAALEALKEISEPRILDIGCGSGCVGICIAHRMKNANIVAIDSSPAAVEITKRNAQRHSVNDRIDARIGDLFSSLQPHEKFDAIVSNPPYILTVEIATLAPEVRGHEPRQALDGGPDGFAVIDRIIAGAANSLQPDGWLILEIGAGQSDLAIQRLIAAGFLAEKPIRDGEGIPRVIIARKK